MQGIPRGPNLKTRQNPFNLTSRQLEILGLLAKGLSNNEIADRFVISQRTVEHHISDVLRKLEVSTRAEAIAKAWENALILMDIDQAG